MGSRLEEKSKLVRKRIENHTFQGEEGDEYESSNFGGFGEYFRRKKIKLQNLDAQLRTQSDKPQIFKGVVCHVNGYTQPSLNDLHVMIVQHGGGFLQYLDGKTMVTHIIASNLTPKKKEEFKRYRIVKPAWVVDSIKALKLLPWDSYRVIEEGAGQRVLGFENGQVVTQANKKAVGYKEQSDTSWYASQLKAAGSQVPESAKKQPAFTQIVTPNEEIEHDEFALHDIDSSMEKILDSVVKKTEVSPTVKEHFPREAKSSIRTPPPSSPSLLAKQQEVGRASKDPVDPNHAEDDVEERSALRPKEGEQEPDYSMAVVRDSDVLKSMPPEKLAKLTAEEYNALLLSDPRIRKSTVVNPEFLEQYYRESRLHHLSTWKSDLKSQLQALAAEKSSSQKKIKKLPGQRRYIMHVDFDSFFAAVSLKKSPEYVDKPVAVAHGGGSGSEIASCNYPARKFGIKNGMWMRRAQELCPELKILPYDFPAYEDASRKFYDAILATGGVVQSVSIDEALIDISAICIGDSGTDGVKRNEGGIYREQLEADEMAQRLRNEVLAKTGCNVSVGIGANILQAKVALRKAKPAGQYQLRPEEVLDFIGNLEVQALPGIAWSIGGKLEEIGIKLVKDIREFTREKLVNTLGPKTGEKVWEYARGIDRTEIGDQVIRKSVSAEVNWGVRFENREQVDEFLSGLSSELHKRLIKEHAKGRQLTLKVMARAADAPLDPPKHLGHGKCDTYNKSAQLGVPTNDAAVIAKEAIAMMKSFGISAGELRGIGVQMQKLELLKSGPDGAAASSQRRLQFKTDLPASKLPSAATKLKSAEDPIQDDAKTPEKPRITSINQPSVAVRPVNPDTPKKKPLNVFGTQFILPTQVDPKVLAELPEDIRLKLANYVRPTIETVPDEILQKTTSNPTSRAQSPAVALPTISQLDPSILEALPEDVRAEVLALYRSPCKPREQSLLPQSPRKNRTLPPTKQPVRRKRGGGLFAGKLRGSNATDNSTLTQSNFVARPPTRHLQNEGAAITDIEPEVEEMDPEFLAALPEDIRLEVLDQQRQARLQREGGIDLSMHQRRQNRRKKAAEDETPPEERILELPHHPAKPTFTAGKLSALPDLRVAVKEWYLEYLDEGPFDEDIVSLIKYLRDVVLEEHDIDKAVQVTKWMSWLIEEESEGMDDKLGRSRVVVDRRFSTSFDDFTCQNSITRLPSSRFEPLNDHRNATAMIDASVRLRRAIKLNDVILVQRIIRANPKLLLNPDFDDKSNTSLHIAASHGHLDTTLYLIRAGHESVEISRNVNHETPLMLAARNGHVEVGKMVVQEFPRCVPFANKQGLDALALSSQNPASTALIPVLLGNAEYRASPHVQDQDGNTPLHHASASGSLKALRILLAAGANPLAKNNYDWTPLAYSQTVAAEVYFKNLVAELQKLRVEGAKLGEERERQRAAGLRIVEDDGSRAAMTGSKTSFTGGEDEVVGGQWSPVERRQLPAPSGRHDWNMRARAGSSDS